MDAEQAFVRVQERISQVLTPRVREGLEYLSLFIAVTTFCLLVLMNIHYVNQPGCSSELSGFVTTEAHLMQIKITSAGLWSHAESESKRIDVSELKSAADKIAVSDVNGDDLKFLASKFWLNWIGSDGWRGKLVFMFWKTNTEPVEHQTENSAGGQNSKPVVEDAVIKTDNDEPQNSFTLSAKETLKAAVMHFGKKWYSWISFISVQWLDNRSKAFEPTYLYSVDKGYLLLPDSAKLHHNIHSINISISAGHSCFGNRWQQLLINRIVGYETVLINSLLSSCGQGYLYNYQTKETYNLSHAQVTLEGPATFGDKLVTKCGFLIKSLFVFLAATMSVSFILREIQTLWLNFTVELQHHALRGLPIVQLIFVLVFELLVFVPIMIGILIFLFEFYEDQLLAFMVVLLVWLCELFTLLSVRTPISMKYFPCFFMLYFVAFHIYFFSYPYGFTYLALSTAGTFTQHLILYLLNRFEVPAIQRIIHIQETQHQNQQNFHITTSTTIAYTLRITRLTTRDQGLANTDLTPASNPTMPQNGAGVTDPQGQSENNSDRAANPERIPGPGEGGPNTGFMNSFSYLLSWILGGASSVGNSLFSMVRDVREQDEVFYDPLEHDNPEGHAQD